MFQLFRRTPPTSAPPPPDYGARRAEIAAIIEEQFGERERNIKAREAAQAEARSVLLHARDFTFGALADAGNPATAAVFKTEFNRRLGLTTQ